MNKIPRFEKRFNKAIEDHVFNLAKELFTEGFTEIDVRLWTRKLWFIRHQSG